MQTIGTLRSGYKIEIYSHYTAVGECYVGRGDVSFQLYRPIFSNLPTDNLSTQNQIQHS
jgi:hypothetical protein